MSKLNEMIKRSTNVKLHPKAEGEYWFSVNDQKQYLFTIAADLLIKGYCPEESLDLAEELIDRFFKDHINKATRKEI